MWKKLLGTTLIAAFALSSCTDKDVYQGPKEDEKEFNAFLFSTVQKDVSLNVNYVNGAVQSNVYFEVYDEMPVAESEYGTYIKRQDVNYLFAAYTKEDGTYQITVVWSTGISNCTSISIGIICCFDTSIHNICLHQSLCKESRRIDIYFCQV